MADKHKGEPPPPSKADHEMEALQGQFDEQQQLIGQLRDALKSQESTKAPESGMEDYASRLAKMKPRLLRGRSAGTKKRESRRAAAQISKTGDEASPGSQEKFDPNLLKEAQQDIIPEPLVPEQSPSVATDPQGDVSLSLKASIQPDSSLETEVVQPKPIAEDNSTTQNKIGLLRRKLEENRIKFERQQRENANKRATMDDMRDRIEKLREEVEHRDHLIESLQDTGPADPNVHHLYQQILHKDNTIMELTDTVNQLELVIKDQTEQLSEKDQIISARTEAVGLVSKDKDEKLVAALDEVDSLRNSIKQTEKNFQAKEESWAALEKSLNAIVEEKTKKATVLEENYQRLENVRFELSTTNAEIQEKLVKVQAQCHDLNKALKSAEEQCRLQKGEITELNKKVSRAEAFGQKKLKVFEKYFRGLENEEVKEQISKLSNEIAMLEEEKGNLQLKLVDFDDLKDIEEKNQKVINKLQNDIEALENSSKSQVAVITGLENSKIGLVDALNKRNIEFHEIEGQSNAYQGQIEHLQQVKVTLELKLCALEEERDIAVQKSQILETEDSSDQPVPLSADMLEENQELSDQISQLKICIKELEDKCSQYQEKIDSQKKEFATAIEIKEEKLEENQCLIELLAEKESAITTQAIKIENSEILQNKLQLEITDKITTVQGLQETTVTLEDEKKALEDKVTSLQKLTGDMETKNSEFSAKLNSQEEKIKELHKICDEYKESTLSLKKAYKKLEYEVEGARHDLGVKDTSILEKGKQIEELKAQVAQESSETEVVRQQYAEKCLEENRLRNDIEKINEDHQEKKLAMETELNLLGNMIKDKDNEVQSMMMELEVKDKEISNNQEMISKFEESLCSKNVQISELESLREKCENEIMNLNMTVKELEQQISEKSSRLDEFSQLSSNSESSIKLLQEEVMSKSTQIKGLQTSLEQFHLQQQEATNELQNTKSSSMEICELLQKEIDNKNNELISLQSVLDQERATSEETIKKVNLKLSKKADELHLLQQQLLNKDAEISQINQQLTDLTTSHQDKAHLLTETQSMLEKKNNDLLLLQLQFESQTRDKDLSESESNDNKLIPKIAEIEEELRKAEGTITDLRGKCSDLEKVCSETTIMKEAAMEQCYVLQNQINSMQTTAGMEARNEEAVTTTSAASFFDSLSCGEANETKESTETQKHIEELQEQKHSLEKDLENARQEIVRLETSLATQTSVQEEQSESDWGTIDLGQTPTKESSAPMQTALTEKDKALTVIQEQLKDALQQVNSAVDEKKLIEHQLKTLEAELEHKDNTVKKYMEELASVRDTIEKEESNKTETSAVKEASDWFGKTSEQEIVADSFNLMSSQPALEEPSATIEESKPSNLLTEEAIAELQYKLSWYEEQWGTWTENYTQLQTSLQEEQQKRISLEEETKRQLLELEEARQTVDGMREKQVQAESYSGALQDTNRNFQEQITKLEASLAESCNEIANLRSQQNIQTEMENLMQENALKSEGSKSRIQELELMVQSAESEISRLRSDMTSLTEAGKSLETERATLKEELVNLKEELRKNNCEKERIQTEYDKLQEQTAAQASANLEMQETSQRTSALNEQLQSELEVLEGDSGRMRMNYEILEGECNRLRNEIAVLTQNNQILEAQCDSMNTEFSRLTKLVADLQTENTHLTGETQRLSEVATSAESEISRLRGSFGVHEELQTQNELLQNQVSELHAKYSLLEERSKDSLNLSVDEVDWSTEGKIEDEHLQTSSVQEETKKLEDRCRIAEERVSNLLEEFGLLKQSEVKLEEELLASKKANAKMVQKVKANNLKLSNLQKEIQELKSKPTGLSDLDLAVEAEFKAQIEKAQSERDEFRTKMNDLEKEKSSLLNQLDVFQNAEGKYIDIKEAQDSALASFSERNKQLEGEVSSLEWKISELEEIIEQQKSSSNVSSTINPSLQSSPSEENVSELRKQLDILTQEKNQLEESNKRVQSLLDNLQIEYNTLKEIKDKLEVDSEKYKTSYLELYTEHQKLTERDHGATQTQSSLEQELDMLKASYNALHYDYQSSQVTQAAMDRDLSMAAGENEKLKEEIESLQKQLNLMQEEEEEEIIKGLQGECESLRETIGLLKNEMIELSENARQAENENERTKRSLEKQIEIQDLLREELSAKIGEVNFLNASVGTQESDLKFERAEIAALKAQVAKLVKVNTDAFEKLKASEEQLASIKSTNTSSVSVRSSSLSATADDGRRASESTEQTGLDSSQVSGTINDMRCQQMALEINKLLEERDALQLKLSSSLRRNQQLERELSLSQHLPASPPSSSLLVKLDELRELNSSLEEKAVQGSFGNTLPPTLPTFVSHTAPPTPTASRHKELSVSREASGTSSTLVNWILGKSAPKEVLHV